MIMKKCVIWFFAGLLIFALCGCGKMQDQSGLGNGWEIESSMRLEFATQFSVDYYAGNYKLITLGDGSRFLVIPEGGSIPKGVNRDIVVLHQPLENIYLAATSAMCLFDAMDRLDSIRLSGTRENGWYIENARLAMQRGEILFAGKYSEPDYELILGNGCTLAIESQMIGHTPEVMEKLEELGIAVLIDQSSNEPHPLGRTEWIKLYGALLNEEEKAQQIFDRQRSYVDTDCVENTGKTAVFFGISSSGYIIARKSGDYVCKMIELAGGNYAFSDLGDPEKATSTVTLEMESFYITAKEADYIIYNNTIDGKVRELEDLLEKNELFEDFKAVRNGNVWCTSQNMFQDTTGIGQMIQSFCLIFSGQADELDEVPYLYRLR